MVAELTTPQSLGALASAIFLLILLPLLSLLKGRTPLRGTPHLALRRALYGEEAPEGVLLDCSGPGPWSIGWSMSNDGSNMEKDAGILITREQVCFTAPFQRRPNMLFP